MKQFLVLYHAPPSFEKKMQGMTQEEMNKEMGKWMTWAQDLGKGIVDMGKPLRGGKKLMKTGTAKNSKREVTGYSVIQAESMKEAIASMKGHPHLVMDDTCEIEIHEMAPTPGQ